jgi:hypothetical protein
MQQESAKRTALEQRLYFNLSAQSETMVGMELKLLRLEAKVERRESAQTNNTVVSPSCNPRGYVQASMESQREFLEDTPPIGVGSENVAFLSSANSLASGVTAESFVGVAENGRPNGHNEVDSQRSSK